MADGTVAGPYQPRPSPRTHFVQNAGRSSLGQYGIALSADATTICEAATISNYVALLDRGTLEVIATIPGMGAPAEAETSLDGRYCFVTNRDPNINALSVIS